MNSLVVILQNHYIEAFDMTNPLYNKLIFSVPWHFHEMKVVLFEPKE